MLKRILPLLSLAVAAPALAQDADGDGAADAADAFPCDPARAAVSYFPGQSTSALLTFEDQWPAYTDLDFNDVAVRAHYRLERDAAGRVVKLHAVLDPVALGGEFSNGLALQVPAPRAGVSVRRRVGGAAWEALALEGDADATAVLSANLRELFGQAAGPINARGGEARRDGARLEVELGFDPPAPLPVAEAPFDLFIFRAGDLGHQIHFPQYAGTAAMNAALFGSTPLDGSTATRRFVHSSGVPAALNLMTTTRYPLEGVAISSLFPDIAGFARSGGARDAGFYASAVVASQGHDVPALALPAEAAADAACLRAIVHYDAGDAASYPGSGTTWSNLAGSAFHGTLHNGVGYSSRGGGTLVFDGVNDVVVAGDIARGRTEFSVELWLRTTDTRTGANGTYMNPAICGTQHGSGLTGDFSINVRGGRLGFYSELQGDYSYFDTGVTIADGTWRNVVLTRSAAGQIVVHVDGSEVFSRGGFTAALRFADLQHFGWEIGRAYWYGEDASMLRFAGDIAVHVFHDRALSSAEVSTRFEARRPRFTAEALPSCRAILDAGASVGSGVYAIDPDGPGGAAAFDAYCEMTMGDGGWTLIESLSRDHSLARASHATIGFQANQPLNAASPAMNGNFRMTFAQLDAVRTLARELAATTNTNGFTRDYFRTRQGRDRMYDWGSGRTCHYCVQDRLMYEALDFRGVTYTDTAFSTWTTPGLGWSSGGHFCVDDPRLGSASGDHWGFNMTLTPGFSGHASASSTTHYWLR